MKSKQPRVAITQIALQTKANAAKGEVVPGDIFGVEQSDGKAFVPGRIVRALQVSAIEEMDLANVRNADQRERRVYNNPGACLFMSFANRPLGS